MEKKIYIVSYVSYTNEDDYLYSSSIPFANKKDARKEFKKECELARVRCELGNQWDVSDEFKYEVEENRTRNTYEASSAAYDGYKVKVTITENEV